MLRQLSQIILKPASKISILRHAETNYNWPRMRIQGSSTSNHIVVSEKGKQEAISKLSFIKFPDILFCSPLLRCKQTAEHWAGEKFDSIKSKKILIDGLKEINAGDLEHFYVDELQQAPDHQKIWQLWKNDPLHFTQFPNGETLQQFQKRVLSSFSKICKYHIDHPNQDIGVITHGGPIRILKCFLENKDLSHMWDDKVVNLQKLELTPEQITKLIKFFSENDPSNKEVKMFRETQKNKSELFESKSSGIRLGYYDKPYKADHWALHVPTIEDKNFIAILKINGVKIALELNPTDARGYRGIAVLVEDDKAKMGSTFNREYSIEEKLALNTALSVFARAYENYGMIAQISIAGNNSQSIKPDGSVQLGNEKEPSLLHGHIIGRGNPEVAYIGDVTLKGPKAGAEMNLRGDGSDEGNRGKVKWKDEDLEIVAKGLASEVINILKSSAVLRNVEIFSIRANESTKLLSTTSYRKMLGAAALLTAGAFGLFLHRSGGSSESTSIVSAIRSKL